MKKILFAMCALLALVACNDADPIPISAAVQNSFQARYPEAQSVRWGSSGDYIVADFYIDAGGVPEQCQAWFTHVGEWYMTLREKPYSALPQAVQVAYESGEYATWIVDDVIQVERIDATQYLIVADGFYLGVESEAYLFYLPSGVLAQGVVDPDLPFWAY